jgi:hypothetical protein
MSLCANFVLMASGPRLCESGDTPDRPFMPMSAYAKCRQVMKQLQHIASPFERKNRDSLMRSLIGPCSYFFEIRGVTQNAHLPLFKSAIIPECWEFLECGSAAR